MSCTCRTSKCVFACLAVWDLSGFRVLFAGPSTTPRIMTRFSALTSDSSDDEQTPYTSQDAHKQPPGSPTRSVDMDDDSPSSSSEEEEDIEVDEEEDDESEDSPDMDEDDLVVEKPGLTRPRSHALVEDSDGDIQYEHTRSRSESSSLSESDSEGARLRGATVASWAGRVGIDAQKMHVMQTSLFRMPEEAAALQAMNQPMRSRFKLSPTVSRKHSRDSVGDGRLDSQEVRASVSHCSVYFTTTSRGSRSLTTSIILFTGHPESMHASTYQPPL